MIIMGFQEDVIFWNIIYILWNIIILHRAHSDYLQRQLSVTTVPYSHQLNGLLQEKSVMASRLAFRAD